MIANYLKENTKQVILMHKLKSFLLSFLMLLFFTNIYASHIKGGEITWQCLGTSAGSNAGKYVFQLKIYRDCNGITMAFNVEPIHVVGNPAISVINCNPFIANDLTPPGCGITCATTPFGSGNYQAVQEFVYKSNPITINGVPPVTGWIFYWNNICCRNNVDNLTGENQMVIRSKMFAYNGKNANPCFDTSPYFAEHPTSFLCIGYDYNYNNTAIDTDLDSLQFGWDYALDGFSWPALPLVFVSPYTVSDPFPGIPFLDSASGQLTIHFISGITQGNYASVIRANAYRGNQKIAEIYREIQISFSSVCPFLQFGPNNPPILAPTPFQDTAGFYTSYDTAVYAGDTVKFILSMSDFDIKLNGAFQVATLDPFGEEFATNFSTSPPSGCSRPPCAYLADTVSTYPVLIPPLVTTPNPLKNFRFIWPTSCGQVWTDSSSNATHTYHFILRLHDDACPVPAYNTKTVSITVKGPQIDVHGDTLITNFPNGTLQWYMNGILIPNATNPTYITNGLANYTVVATLPGSNCQVSSSSVAAGTVAVNELLNRSMDLKIYPNPAKEQITVEINAMSMMDVNFIVNDLQGRAALKSNITVNRGNNKFNFALSGLQKGIYIAKILSAENELIKKLVIE